MNDNITSKIETLIQEENSASDRVRLMILLQISSILSDISKSNSEVIARLDATEAKIDSHILHNRRVEDKFAGAKKVLAALFIVAQAGFGYIGYQVIETPKRQQEAIIHIDKRLAVLESKVEKK